LHGRRHFSGTVDVPGLGGDLTNTDTRLLHSGQVPDNLDLLFLDCTNLASLNSIVLWQLKQFPFVALSMTEVVTKDGLEKFEEVYKRIKDQAPVMQAMCEQAGIATDDFPLSFTLNALQTFEAVEFFLLCVLAQRETGIRGVDLAASVAKDYPFIVLTQLWQDIFYFTNLVNHYVERECDKTAERTVTPGDNSEGRSEGASTPSSSPPSPETERPPPVFVLISATANGHSDKHGGQGREGQGTTDIPAQDKEVPDKQDIRCAPGKCGSQDASGGLLSGDCQGHLGRHIDGDKQELQTQDVGHDASGGCGDV